MYYRNKINIKQAIDYVVRSWDEVTTTTIVNCWNKTGILPCSVDNNQTEFVVEEPSEQLETISTPLLSTDFAGQVEDYIKAVDEPLEENLTEADIVSMVKTDAMVESETVFSDTDYEEDEVVVKPISNIEALTHLKGLIRFQEQSPDEVFTADELNVLRRKISTFEYLIDKAKKQSLLDCYLEK